MNGMRKVGRSSAHKKEASLSDEELDFDQGIEQALEDNLPEDQVTKVREDDLLPEIKEDGLVLNNIICTKPA
jgi:hypothetical protein